MERGHLVLTRAVGESLVIGEGAAAVTVTVEDVRRGQVRLRVVAPKDVRVDRQEVWRRRESERAVGTTPVPPTPPVVRAGDVAPAGWTAGGCGVCHDPNCDNPGGKH